MYADSEVIKSEFGGEVVIHWIDLDKRDVNELLTEAVKDLFYFTGDLEVERGADGEEYEVFNRVGSEATGDKRHVFNVWLWFCEEGGFYVSDCSCYLAPQGEICRHVLAVLKTIDIDPRLRAVS